MPSGNTYFRCISMTLPYFLALMSIFDEKIVSQWVHHIPAITCDEGIRCHLIRIQLFYFDDNFRRKALWVLALRLNPTELCDINYH